MSNTDVAEAGAEETQPVPIAVEESTTEDSTDADGSNEPEEASAVAVDSDEEERTKLDADPPSDEAILVDSMDVVSDAGIDALEASQPDNEELPAPEPEQASDEDDQKPKRRGWWQRSSA